MRRAGRGLAASAVLAIAGTVTFAANVRLNNYGTLDVEDGTLSLQGGYNFGTVIVAPGAQLTYNGVTYTQDSEAAGPFTATSAPMRFVT